MTYLGLIAAVPILLWVALFIIAPVKVAKTARNFIGGRTRPVGPLNRDGSTTAFADIQEKAEFRFYNLLGIAGGVAVFALFAYLIAANDWSWWLLPFATSIGTPLSEMIARKVIDIDPAGHGAEIMAAEDAGDRQYQSAEIARMLKNNDWRRRIAKAHRGPHDTRDDAKIVSDILRDNHKLAKFIYRLAKIRGA